MGVTRPSRHKSGGLVTLITQKQTYLLSLLKSPSPYSLN